MNKLQLSAAIALLSVSSVFAASPRRTPQLVRGYQMCVWYDAQQQTLGTCRNRRSERVDVYGRLVCAQGTVKVVTEVPVRFCPEPVIL
jgi:hypothetical protein